MRCGLGWALGVADQLPHDQCAPLRLKSFCNRASSTVWLTPFPTESSLMANREAPPAGVGDYGKLGPAPRSDGSEAYYKYHLEQVVKENSHLKHKLDQMERENQSLKMSLYELNTRYLPAAAARPPARPSLLCSPSPPPHINLVCCRARG